MNSSSIANKIFVLLKEKNGIFKTIFILVSANKKDFFKE